MKKLLLQVLVACSILIGLVTPAAADDIVVVSATPTVSTTLYTSGDAIGGLMSFPGAGRTNGGAGLLQAVTVAFKGTQTAAMDFFWCDGSNIPNSAITDNDPVSVGVADFAACRPVVITNCTSVGTPTVCVQDNLALPYSLSSGITGYGFLVTRGSPKLNSTSDVYVTLRLIRN